MVVLTVLFFSLLGLQNQLSTSEDVINKMHDTYALTWYTNFTFVQNTTFYQQEKVVKEQIWYEALSSPGKLHIKFDSFTSGSGMLFADGHQYRYRDNKILSTQKKHHALLLTAFDIYKQPVKTSIEQLNALGFDLSKLHTTDENGRKIYVIGANKEDLTSNQFWIDAEHLYVTRVITNDKQRQFIMDVKFNKYERLSGGWIAPEVLIYVNGNLYMKEEYTNMATPSSLDQKIFRKENISTSKW